jgi:hypothetical protein
MVWFSWMIGKIGPSGLVRKAKNFGKGSNLPREWECSTGYPSW